MKKNRVYALITSLMVVGLFYGINEYRLKSEIQPVKIVVAKQDIPPHTQITPDMLKEVVVSYKSLPQNIYYAAKDVVGKWTQVDYGLSQNSYFFDSKVVTADKLADAERMKLKPGQKPFTLSTNIETSAAGNVIPGSLVDVWWTSRGNEEGKIISGRIYQGIYVLSSKNRQAENLVSKNVTNPPQSDGKQIQNQDAQVRKELVPSIVQLAVDDDQFQVLQAAAKLGTISLVPKDGPLVKSANEAPDMTNAIDIFDVKPILLKRVEQTTGLSTLSESIKNHANQKNDIKGGES
ncbi:Flp pilus assembly protein CpaB [Aneurinibacillus thermoaerophilus]|uniref:Flp pilus assembly protein CpaB n=1 Tax=Aneurinibacillus thermoaerophilus TaxID=143495 RepID=UPI002E1C5B8E|nr:Flp pilus assembly protein CpaB [Aneurinibacillus thermoaerophilus]